MGLKTGASILTLKNFLMERFSPNAWVALMRLLSSTDQTVLSSVIAKGWYDLTLHARLNRALCDLFYDGSLAGAEELGRYTAEQEVMISRQWMARLTRPSWAVRHFNMFWCQAQDSGVWTTEVRETELTTRLSGWEGHDAVLCRRLLGYISRRLEALGPLTRQHHDHLHDGSSCTFSFQWHLERDITLEERVSSRAEIPEIVQELAQFPDLDSLSNAIINLVHFHLDFPYVELWVYPTGSDPCRLARTEGTKKTGVQMRLLLQTAGRFVGRLDLEASTVSRHDLLQDLIPAVALALDGVRQSSQQLSCDRQFTCRLSAAQAKWSLTRKETEVLEHLIRGERTKEIASKLNSEPGTIDQHVTRILRKSDADGRSELSWKFWTDP